MGDSNVLELLLYNVLNKLINEAPRQQDCCEGASPSPYSPHPVLLYIVSQSTADQKEAARGRAKMAETVLSMARSLLGSAVSKAAAAASEEMSLLMGVQKEIWLVLPPLVVPLPSAVTLTPSLLDWMTQINL